MTNKRTAARCDSNQAEIVKALRDLPGVTVALNHDDILCGYKGKTFWYEIKSGNALDKSGRVTMVGLKKTQIDLMRDWRGHYRIVSSIEDIIAEIFKE